MNTIWWVALVGLLIGTLFQIALKFYLDWNSRKQAESLAQDLLGTAQETADEVLDLIKEKCQDYGAELIEKNEADFGIREERIQKLQSHTDRVRSQLHNKWLEKKKLIDQQQKDLGKWEQDLSQKNSFLDQKIKITEKMRSEHIDQLTKNYQLDRKLVLEELKNKILNRQRSQLFEHLELEEEKFKEHLEKSAKKIIDKVLNRFARPYCSERGIGFIVFDSDRDLEKVLGPKKSYIEIVEKICGVDVIFNEKAKTLSVSGFDPVRRELGRATLEALQKERKIDEKSIPRIVEHCKKRLLHQIKQDGNRVAKELRCEDLKPEIKNMMGALRYRYSFTQNQYFHCAEVGHLCGLLASELGEKPSDARRAGLLHDIGKAMDHSIDGGHAVIGADFIQKNGEPSHIVHAVRAHHFDEMPSTNLAYLVIAADAISGARPGARRSTTSTYLQKLDQLQEIGNSFEGVIDTFILSAGREVRILVDNQKVDDYKALELSKAIAKKIEQDCNYPGTIKVTVVRESQAVDMAR